MMGRGFFEESVGRCAETPFIALPVVSHTFPLHYHKEIEIYYVISGEVDITVDGERILAKKGDIVICMPWQCHSFLKNGEFMFVRTSVDLGADCRDLSNLRTPSPRISAEANGYSELKSVVDEIIGAFGSADKDRMFLLNSLTNLLIYKMLKLLPFYEMSAEERDAEKARIDFVRELERYVADNYAFPIDLADVAQHFCLSVGYFSRCFKKYLNTTFVNYLTAYRGARAAELLIKTSDSVESIAERCGFVSYRNLNRAFASLYGKSPSSYRKYAKKSEK